MRIYLCCSFLNSVQGQVLTHSYTFDTYEGTNLYNHVTGTFDAAIHTAGSGTYTIHAEEGTLALNGSSNVDGAYVTLPETLLATNAPAITVETWATTDVLRQFSRIFEFGYNSTGSGTPGFLFVAISPNSSDNPVIRANIGTVSGSGVAQHPCDVSGYDTGEEHLITYVANDQNITLYIDGVNKGSVACGTETLHFFNSLNNGTNTPTHYLGKAHWKNDDYWDGSFNEFNVYVGAMTDTQVAARYAAGTDSVKATAQVSNLIGNAMGYWDGTRATFGKVTTLADLRGNTHFLQGINMKFQTGTESRTGYEKIQGNNANGIVFGENATSGHCEYRVASNTADPILDLGTSSDPTENDFTVAARVYLNSYSETTINDFVRAGSISGLPQVTYGIGADRGNFSLFLTPEGENTFQTFSISDYQMEGGRWYDVAAIFSAESQPSITLYVLDSATGELLGDAFYEVDFNQLESYAEQSRNFMFFAVPSDPNTHAHNDGGLLDYVGIWNEALSLDQIQILAGVTDAHAVPEPSTWGLLGLGIGCLFLWRRRR
ncbi:MAG: LamG-like jellyroll fold domain-containing protein [Planctomycetia bacterium]|nr:LamG-like jellyroll fold domain-containing protein [Planctomycetia bacterium]